jgi:signal transduction histidine kinase
MEGIKQKINRLLLDKGIKKQDFLDNLAISTSTYYDMIKKNNLTVDLILKMSEMLEVPVTYFLSESNNMESVPEERELFPNIREEYIKSLTRQNEEMSRQITDLIKMQLINAETIKILTSK